jgi:hypothetical protein
MLAAVQIFFMGMMATAVAEEILVLSPDDTKTFFFATGRTDEAIEFDHLLPFELGGKSRHLPSPCFIITYMTEIPLFLW